ncbi:MAG: hypothetical protein JW882_19690 [Deltaproteobacteria bacterium]|nr:hypothetical protein [Deltaproteobacteria bacterium]
MKINRCFLFLALNAILFINGCSSVYMSVKGKVLTSLEMSTILTELRIQEDVVNSLYSTGSIIVKDWKSEKEANSLIVGERDPFRLKIEITHSWGRPLLHILMNEDIIEILSFDEGKLYRGHNKSEILSHFLSGIDPQLIWTVARGYPLAWEHHKAISSGRNRMTLLDNEGKGIEMIYLDPYTLQPDFISFPTSKTNVKFLSLAEEEGIYYAREVVAETDRETLILKNSKIFFNKSIPDEIFSIKRPPMFEIVDLDHQK